MRTALADVSSSLAIARPARPVVPSTATPLVVPLVASACHDTPAPRLVAVEPNLTGQLRAVEAMIARLEDQSALLRYRHGGGMAGMSPEVRTLYEALASRIRELQVRRRELEARAGVGPALRDRAS